MARRNSILDISIGKRGLPRGWVQRTLPECRVYSRGNDLLTIQGLDVMGHIKMVGRYRSLHTTRAIGPIASLHPFRGRMEGGAIGEGLARQHRIPGVDHIAMTILEPSIDQIL